MSNLRLLFSCVSLLMSLICSANAFEPDSNIKNLLKLSILNPGIEFESILTRKTTMILNPGIGYNISYPKLTEFTPSGWLYLIAPYLDTQFRFYYNIEKRKIKDLYANNSANYFSLRGLYRGKSIYSNFTRTSQNDFSISTNWGLQRIKRKNYCSLNIGPMYYLDFEGNEGVFLNVEINMGRIL